MTQFAWSFALVWGRITPFCSGSIYISVFFRQNSADFSSNGEYISTYLAEPLSESRNPCKDGGFLHFIAGARGHKAGHTLDVPLTILSHAVQRPSRVSLRQKRHREDGLVFHTRQTQAALFGLLTYIASSYNISSSADHGALDGNAPPVAAAAHTVLDHRQQSLLQFIRHGPMSWDTQDRTADIHTTQSGLSIECPAVD